MNSSLTSDPWISRLIGDRQRYRIEKRLGAGGMGDVFLAMDTLLGQQVALKLLKDTLLASEDLRKRFEREVALCAALKSDHIVQVSDYGVTPEGYPFYVMEYLGGQSLGQLLRQQQRLDVKRTVSIISQVCEGLRLAHQGVTLWRHGATANEHVLVVHRDLKPDNIFLVPTALGELVKILDFGIAKIHSFESAEYTNLTDKFIGTFHYASPEQLAAQTDIDGRADIYSLGIILYEMLSGTDPFGLGLNVNKISSLSWALAHSSKLPVPLRSQPGCEQLSPHVEAVAMRCLQKAPDERFASVDELNEALQAAVAAPHPPSLALQASTTVLQQLTSPLQVFSNGTPQQLTPKQSDLQPPTAVVTGFQEMDIPLTQVNPLTPSKLIDDRQIIPSNAQPRKFPLLLNGAGVAIAIITISTAYTYLNWLPKETIPNEIVTVDEIKALQAEAKYAKCITKVKSVTEDLSIYVKAQELLHKCQMEQAKKLVAGNKFAEAITVASTIPKHSPLHSKAQELSGQWSNHIMALATAQFQAGKLDTALAQVEAISTTSPAYQKAQAAIVQWQKDWQVAEAQFSAAKLALDEGEWQVAVDKSNKVPNISYWKEKIKPIVQEAQSQIAKAKAAAKAEALPTYESPTQTSSRGEPFKVHNLPSPAARSYKPSDPPVKVYNSAPSAPQSSTANGGWEDLAPEPPADKGWEDSAPEPPVDGGWEDSPSEAPQSGDI